MSLTDLTGLCTSLAFHATSITAAAIKLASSLEPDNQNVLQLNLMAASLEQLHRSTTQLEQALKAAPLISRELNDRMCHLLAACAGRMDNLYKDFMKLQPADLSSLNGSFLTTFSGLAMIHGQVFVFFTGVVSQYEQTHQEQSLDSTAARELINQAETSSQLVDKLRILQSNVDNAKSPTRSDSRQPPTTNKEDAPPPYVTPVTSPASPTTIPSPGRSKGSSFFRAITSGFRSKPDPLVSALCQAIVQGNEQQISGLISQGANINGSNEDGRTPLRCAIRCDQAAAARLLLSSGVKTSKSWSGLPPLFQAASKGSLNVAQVLLEFGSDIHSKAASGQPHLVDVVNKGNVAGIGFLLASGAAADTKDITGQQIIVTAAKKGNIELVRLLIDHGADINAADIVGNPILATAIDKGDTSMLELLLDRHVNLDARTNLGTSILEHAITRRKFDIAKRLLVGGANPEGTDVHAQPVLIKILRDALLKTSDKMEILKLLFDNGVDPDTADAIWGLPAICHAVEMSKAPVVEEMLRRGAKTKVRMLAGQTLLTYSIDVNHRKHIKALLDYGVDVNEVDGLNRTPLTLALLRLDYNLAKMFVDHGADATSKANKQAVKFIKAIKRNDFLELFSLGGSAASESAMPEGNSPILFPYIAEMPESGPIAEMPASVPPPSYELAAGKW
ncbi:hypothetical protein ACHAPA_009887 [Fusarium lateritium]